MKLNTYQKKAIRTAPDLLFPANLNNAVFGLCGEAGEVSEHLKKYLFHKKELNRVDLCKELGDVLWYVAYAAHTLNFTLEEIAHVNINKLQDRYPDGFPSEGA